MALLVQLIVDTKNAVGVCHQLLSAPEVTLLNDALSAIYAWRFKPGREPRLARSRAFSVRSDNLAIRGFTWEMLLGHVVPQAARNGIPHHCLRCSQPKSAHRELARSTG